MKGTICRSFRLYVVFIIQWAIGSPEDKEKKKGIKDEKYQRRLSYCPLHPPLEERECVDKGCPAMGERSFWSLQPCGFLETMWLQQDKSKLLEHTRVDTGKPSSMSRWKQKQTPTAKHKAELWNQVAEREK